MITTTRQQQVEANYQENRELAELTGIISPDEAIDAETLADLVEGLYGDIV